MAFAAFADAPVDVAVVEVGTGRPLGRHERRRRAGRRDHPDRRRPRRVPRLATSRTSPREKAGHHQAGLGRASSAEQTTRGDGGAAANGSPRSTPRSPARACEFGVLAPRGRRRRPAARSCRASAASTTTSSCRCTASTRRTTPRWRSPRSRRSSARAPTASSTSTRSGRASPPSWPPGRLERVRSAPDRVRRRRAQPARRRGAGRARWTRVRLPQARRRRRRAWRTRTSRASWRRWSPSSARDRGHHQLLAARHGRRRARAASPTEIFGEDRVDVRPRLADAIETAIRAGGGRRGEHCPAAA